MQRMLEAATRRFGQVAGAAIMGMMVLTCADVLLRLLRRPVPGTYELVGFLGALAVALALAQTSAEHGHIAVSFLVDRLPPAWQRRVDVVNAITAGVFFALIAWQCGVHATRLRAVGEVSMTLQMPVYPIAYGVAAGCGLLSLGLAARAVAHLLPAR